MEQTSFQNNPQVMRFKRFSGKGYSVFRSLGRVINIGVVAGIALASAYSSTASAQNVSNPSQAPALEGDEQELREVVVTASKLATPLNQTAKQVTVITQAQIASAPVRSLQDLLVYLAGVDVSQRGGHGVQADISIRGGSFDQNAVLLNGINLSNAETGHLSYDIPINLSDIERIEVIHGPSALVYGTSAFSGGINIITRKDVAERLYAQISAGQHKSTALELRGAWQLGKTTSSLSFGRKSSAGYRDNTDYRIYNALWQTRYNLTARERLDFQLGYNNKAYGANAFYSPKGPKQYEETQSLVASLSGELGTEKLRIVPMLYWNRTFDEYHWVRGTALNHHRADNIGANLVFAYRSALGTTSFGGEFRREDINSSKLGQPKANYQGKYTNYATRTNTSLSLEHTLALNQWILSAGALLNHNTQRKGKFELFPSVSATYKPAENLSISASWSKAVRIPTFIDLYYEGPRQKGNPSIGPERSESLDLSIKYRHKLWSAYVTGFHQRGQDIIDWVLLNPTDVKYQSANLSKLNTYGVETGVALRLGSWLPFLGERAMLKVDYTRLWQKHNSNYISMYALRYLRDKLTARLDHQIGERIGVSWNFRLQKRMGVYESGGQAGVPQFSPYPAFATLDLRLSYKVLNNLELDLSINNLTNREYFDVAAVPQPKLWTNIGLTYRLR